MLGDDRVPWSARRSAADGPGLVPGELIRPKALQNVNWRSASQH
jgi:hypothetical protein